MVELSRRSRDRLVFEQRPRRIHRDEFTGVPPSTRLFRGEPYPVKVHPS